MFYHPNFLLPFGGLLFWFLIVLLIAVVVGLVVKWLFESHEPIEAGPKAGSIGNAKKERLLDILNERYAKSEISKEEYDTKRRDLGL